MQFVNESNLITSLKLGDSKAVEMWYAQSKEKLLTFFLSQIPTPADAEELLHDTYLSCLAALPLFRGESGLWGWMLSIARHELADFWRKYYAKKAIRALPFGDELIERVGEVRSSQFIVHSEIQHILQILPTEVSELLQLKYVDGFTVKQLAKRFGTSVVAMQSKLYRAKEAFAKEYWKLETRN